MPVDKRAMTKLVEELAAAHAELASLTFDEVEEQQLGPPCSAQKLVSLERLLGKPLPPSYRAFLEVHDGWREFDGDGALLAAEEQKAPWVKVRMKALSAQFTEFGGRDPFKNGALPVMLGETIRNYVVLDPAKVRPDGEMEFVQYELTREERRFKDFGAYLRHSLKITRSLIEDEKEGTSEGDEDDDN